MTANAKSISDGGYSLNVQLLNEKSFVEDMICHLILASQD